jgi:hypothetical protein
LLDLADMQDLASPSWPYVVARQRNYSNRAAVRCSELDFISTRGIASRDGAYIPSD